MEMQHYMAIAVALGFAALLAFPGAVGFRLRMASPDDWSGGSGVQRFYERGRTLDEIVERCLMNGVTFGLSTDIPHDSLYGWTVTNIVGNAKQYGFVKVPIGESRFIFTTNSFNGIRR